jgi:hypothetical protein
MSSTESKTLRKTDYLALILIACAMAMAATITIEPRFTGAAFGVFAAVLVVLRVFGEGMDAVEAEDN